MNTVVTLPARAQLRNAAPEDEVFLRALFADSRPDAERALFHTHPFGPMLLVMQFQARQRGYAEHFAGAEDKIIKVDKQEVGRFLVNRLESAFHVIDIALLRAFQGQGIGTALLQQLQQDAAVAQVPVHLTVALGSPAKRWYERLGFQVTEAGETDARMEWTPQ